MHSFTAYLFLKPQKKSDSNQFSITLGMFMREHDNDSFKLS